MHVAKIDVFRHGGLFVIAGVGGWDLVAEDYQTIARYEDFIKLTKDDVSC